ncbi:MAG: hypothetical protein AAF677_11350 [Pseudomonadota bacterium]
MTRQPDLFAPPAPTDVPAGVSASAPGTRQPRPTPHQDAPATRPAAPPASPADTGTKTAASPIAPTDRTPTDRTPTDRTPTDRTRTGCADPGGITPPAATAHALRHAVPLAEGLLHDALATDAIRGLARVDEAALRAAWRELVERRLPAAARTPLGRHWPIHLDHCFARVLLDTVHGRPWRQVVAPPAWRNADPGRLAQAIALGEAILHGAADLAALNAYSLTLRGKRRGGPR